MSERSVSSPHQEPDTVDALSLARLIVEGDVDAWCDQDSDKLAAHALLRLEEQYERVSRDLANADQDHEAVEKHNRERAERAEEQYERVSRDLANADQDHEAVEKHNRERAERAEEQYQAAERQLHRTVALALAFGAVAGSVAGDQIPQDVWDELFDEGLLRTTSHGVPGADMETDITTEGRQLLVDTLTSNPASGAGASQGATDQARPGDASPASGLHYEEDGSGTALPPIAAAPRGLEPIPYIAGPRPAATTPGEGAASNQDSVPKEDL